jgi:hypothetical protein
LAGEPIRDRSPIGVALLRATLPDWRIIDDGKRCFGSGGQHVLTASTPADLATRLAALEYPLRIMPTS